MAVLRAANSRRDYEFEVTAWLAWTTSYLTAYAPQKADKFPKLEKLTAARKRKPQKREDWQSSLARIKAWVGEG